MGKYGDLLKKCDDKRKAMEEAKEERKRQEKIAKSAKLTKGMRALATLLKDVENIDDIFMRYESFTNCIYITFKESIYNLARFVHNIVDDDYNAFLDALSHSYSVAKYDKVKSLIPNVFSVEYKEPTLSMEHGDLKVTKHMAIHITWTKEMNVDDFMEVVIKRLEDGYVI